MKTANVKIWGYDVEVTYELLDTEIDIIDYAFENDEAAEDCGLYDEKSRWYLEDEITQALIEHERTQKAKGGWIAPYLSAKMRRKDVLYRKF